MKQDPSDMRIHVFLEHPERLGESRQKFAGQLNLLEEEV
jgi:hypothetical protein